MRSWMIKTQETITKPRRVLPGGYINKRVTSTETIISTRIRKLHECSNGSLCEACPKLDTCKYLYDRMVEADSREFIERVAIFDKEILGESC